MDPTNEGEEPGAVERTLKPGEQRILSMRPHGQTGSSIELILRKRIAEFVQAIRDKNLERVLAFYAPDVTVFDVGPPLDVRGVAAYRQNFERWFDSFDGSLEFELHRLRVVPGEGAAFCHYLGLVSGGRPGGRASGYWVRGTTCFERRDGEWLVTHEHISMPASA
jgi:ketosteroid isomerase-like protein